VIPHAAYVHPQSPPCNDVMKPRQGDADRSPWGIGITEVRDMKYKLKLVKVGVRPAGWCMTAERS